MPRPGGETGAREGRLVGICARRADRLAADAVAELGGVDLLVPDACVPKRRLVTALDPDVVVNVSSIAAVLSAPGEAGYDASMAVDRWGTGERVPTVYPGPVDAELFSVPGGDPVPAGVGAIPVDDVVDAVLGALADGSVEVYVPAWFKEVAVGKARDVAAFMAGSAVFVRGQLGA